MMTDLGLERLRKGDTHPLFNYTTYTESGKTLKSCTIWLRDSDGEIYGAFCINIDVTAVIIADDFLRGLAPDTSRTHVAEDFVQDLRDMLDTMIAEWGYRTRTPPRDATKAERIDLVRFLDERGAFQVRNAVPIVASRLGVSRKTIYNYLGEVAQDRAAPGSGG